MLGGSSTQQKPESVESRRHPRLRHCLRVMALELPNLRALTVDLSAEGMRLETFSAVETGKALQMELEIGVFPIKLQGLVKWCRPVAEGIYNLGVSVESSSPHNLHAYRRYVKTEMGLNSSEGQERFAAG